MTDKAKCKHVNFIADVEVNRLTNKDGEEVLNISACIKIHCSDCGVKLKFRGLPMGLDLNGAAVSADGTEARLAVFPANEARPVDSKGPSGFNIFHDPSRDDLNYEGGVRK